MLRKQRQKGISMHRFTKPVVSLGIVVVLLAIALGTTLFATPRLRPTRAASAQTYIVLYKAHAVPADAANAILQAGGTLVYSYPRIGVVIASSDNTAFRDNLMTDSQIDSASATTNYGSKIDDGTVDRPVVDLGAVVRGSRRAVDLAIGHEIVAERRVVGACDYHADPRVAVDQCTTCLQDGVGGIGGNCVCLVEHNVRLRAGGTGRSQSRGGEQRRAQGDSKQHNDYTQRHDRFSKSVHTYSFLPLFA